MDAKILTSVDDVKSEQDSLDAIQSSLGSFEKVIWYKWMELI